jgi:uncharacterized protein with HEPN domain
MQSHKEDIIQMRHMLDYARKTVKFTRGRSRAHLDGDEVLALATIHAIEILGEAASAISPNSRRRHPDIPWDLISGTRNRLIHGYIDVDLDIVWTIVKRDLPPLIKQLDRIISKEGVRSSNPEKYVKND